ncbi:MAG: class II D-tagatose-bisphosphate aldolase, non-catalytic subunit [Anaerolineales bacterium]
MDEVVHLQKSGQARGIASICSSHPSVLEAAIRRAVRTGSPLLIESTCNQVNQFGGYTGMRPGDFIAYVGSIARRNGLPTDRVLLGGDHLGPSVWQEEPAEDAMSKAMQLIQAYVAAGYIKLHLDASMRLGDDDPARPLDLEVSAQRLATLAKAAEQAQAGPGAASLPLYVVGTDVPIPGGAPVRAGSAEGAESSQVTRVDDLRCSLELTREAFFREGLQAAWERVMAVVVQPGVEFGDDFVNAYQPEAAAGLAGFIENQLGLVYEAHSTDYQSRAALLRMVRDHFAVLKVGPALTYAFREAVFALAMIEAELFPPTKRSRLIETLEEAMCREPQHWQKHYHGSPAELALARKYSRSDRARYYWPDPQVQAALKQLITNLSDRTLPAGLVSQYAPAQSRRIREGTLENKPEAILLDHIDEVLGDYAYACGQ